MPIPRIGLGWCVVLALALCACDDDDETPPGQRGELDVGTFYYLCAADSDAVCDSDAVVGGVDQTTGAFPPVVVGGDFQINFEPDESTTEAQYIRVGSEAFVTGEGTIFTGVAAGIVALVATNSSDYPFDFVHIRVGQPTALRISQTTTTGQSVDSFAAGGGFSVDGSDVELDISGSVSFTTRTFLRAVPVTDDGRILAGALDTTWQTSDAAIVSIVSDPSNNVIEIEPRANGTATLTVTMGQVTAAVTIQSGA